MMLMIQKGDREGECEWRNLQQMEVEIKSHGDETRYSFKTWNNLELRSERT